MSFLLHKQRIKAHLRRRIFADNPHPDTKTKSAAVLVIAQAKL
jgi:hypothetical protein